MIKRAEESDLKDGFFKNLHHLKLPSTLLCHAHKTAGYTRCFNSFCTNCTDMSASASYDFPHHPRQPHSSTLEWRDRSLNPFPLENCDHCQTLIMTIRLCSRQIRRYKSQPISNNKAILNVIIISLTRHAMIAELLTIACKA
jgi:hypothetical protein